MLAAWAQWQLLDTGSWGDTSTRIIERKEVRQRLAEYVVSEVRRSAGGLLPANDANDLERAVERALATPEAERVWRTTTLQAHREFVRVIEENGSGRDVVELDLRRLIRTVVRESGMPAPPVPAGVGRITIVAGDQVKGTREAARRLERTAAVLLILAPLCLMLAVAVARGWRLRALAGAGLAIAAAGAIVLLVRALVGAHVVDVLTQSAADRDAVEAAWSAGTTDLARIGGVAIAAGLVVALVAGVAGRPRERYL